MRKLYLPSALLLCIFLNAQGGVGIGTTNPQQKLHLDKNVGTVRVASLDKDNSEYNGGNSNLAATFPLYVDSNGILSLNLQTLSNSNGGDVIDNTTIPASTIKMTSADADGKVEATFFTYSITVARPSILEIKYSVSFEVYQTDLPSMTMIRDTGARRVSTYYTLDNLTRKYGQASKCYMNNNTNNPAPYTVSDKIGAVGEMYNSSSTYIQLPTGTHDIKFKAEISSNLPALNTLVRMAVSTDSVFMRLY